MPNVLSPRDLVNRPDNMDGTVLSSSKIGTIAKKVKRGKTEEDTRQLIMERCMLRGTNVRYCKSILGIIAITMSLNYCLTWLDSTCIKIMCMNRTRT